MASAANSGTHPERPIFLRHYSCLYDSPVLPPLRPPIDCPPRPRSHLRTRRERAICCAVSPQALPYGDAGCCGLESADRHSHGASHNRRSTQHAARSTTYISRPPMSSPRRPNHASSPATKATSLLGKKRGLLQSPHPHIYRSPDVPQRLWCLERNLLFLATAPTSYAQAIPLDHILATICPCAIKEPFCGRSV
ncbi:hypothetical protein SNOG_00227 [Parastagonospora nodorum SN15]|uniref:Uncharacterized protein n=1 Tax=Phaeosphaeria nodorum (strain SN15 / ATCC MYA-4574 / FGSC 10173) TaxID=321614 RepID=Q0V6Y7_PHANO|nr:hypothetical protein SNOG_00227 [Parastagonospora nodorum SN15]EAT91722.1 hypothetical protein SNOG_00227 [Parastagonospora nodorum SN15]